MCDFCALLIFLQHCRISNRKGEKTLPTTVFLVTLRKDLGDFKNKIKKRKNDLGDFYVTII